MNKYAQTGAAMVEAVLICVLMMTLMVAIPKLAKFQDVRQATVDASRYAAWQMTVSKEVDREHVIDRHFSKTDAPIRSDNFLLEQNSFWTQNRLPLIRDQAFTPVSRAPGAPGAFRPSLVDVQTLNVSTQTKASSPGIVADAATGTVRTVSNWLGESDAIAPDRGIIKSDVQIAMRTGNEGERRTIECGLGSAVCLSSISAILVDGWEAEGSEAVEAGAQVMVPSQLLKPLGTVLSAASVIPLLKEFKEFDDGLGCVNTTSLPTKELTGELQAWVEPHEC